MKASIITMTCTYNYGATLQAFALQQYIESLGCECDIINHMGWENHRTISYKEGLKSFLLKVLFKKQLELGYERFEKFYKQHMHMTRRYNTVKDLVDDPPDSDLFITGSDQVWNPRDPKYQKFFLEFVPDSRMKISYAASLGDSFIPEDKKRYYSEQLKRFNAISVREEQGKKLIGELTDKDVNVNCDPVILIDSDKWRSLEKPIKNLRKPYILCYMIYVPEWFNTFVKEVKRNTGMDIVVLGLNGISKVYDDKYIRCAGPAEFLWLFDNAEMVISSSFHGNVYSILFEKKLVSLPDPKRPDRIHNLLSLFGLESFELYENDISIIEKLKPVDKETMKKVISQQQQKTNEYFSAVLS